MHTHARFEILGNVGKVTQLGKIVKIGLAVSREWTDDNGKKQKRTDWNTVTVMDETRAAWVIENVGKGDAVYTEGRLGNNKYEKNGETTYSTDLVATIFTVVRKHDKNNENDSDN